MLKTNNVAGVCEEQLAVDSRNSSEKKKNHLLISLCKLSFVLWPAAFVLFYIFEKVNVMFLYSYFVWFSSYPTRFKVRRSFVSTSWPRKWLEKTVRSTKQIEVVYIKLRTENKRALLVQITKAIRQLECKQVYIKKTFLVTLPCNFQLLTVNNHHTPVN